jgi:hypothetical protein
MKLLIIILQTEPSQIKKIRKIRENKKKWDKL